MFEILFQAIKFALVGLFGMGVDFLFTWIFKEKLNLNKFAANSIGFITAVLSNYILNRIWTFSNQNPQILLQFISFLVISIIGLSLNLLFVYLFNEKLKIEFYLSKLLAIGMVFIWNFSANLLFTFNYG